MGDGWGTAGDEVRLVVPAAPDLMRLARVAASGVASRMGFSYDEVEDVRLAVDELCWAASGGSPMGGALNVRFLVLDTRSVAVEGRFEGGMALDGAPVAGGLTRRILATLVDEYDLLPPVDGQGPGFRMVKRKS